MSYPQELWDYARDNHGEILTDLREHAWLALVPVAVAFVLALPLAWVVDRVRWLRQAILAVGSIVYTIPSLALFLLLPGIIGTGYLDPLNVVIALTLYSLALLVRTTADGLGAVDASVLQAATAMGYRAARRWFSVQLPLALPVVFAGLRVATVANVSMVSIAALIGMGGLGELFTRGFKLGFYTPPIIIGLVLTVALALVADLVLVLLQRVLTPWSRVGASR